MPEQTQQRIFWIVGIVVILVSLYFTVNMYVEKSAMGKCLTEYNPDYCQENLSPLTK